MSDYDKERLRQWVANWQEAGRRLEELRQEELPLVDTQRALLSLADAYESCRLHWRPPPTSGLVQQQAIFQRLRRSTR